MKFWSFAQIAPILLNHLRKKNVMLSLSLNLELWMIPDNLVTCRRVLKTDIDFICMAKESKNDLLLICLKLFCHT